MAKKDAKELAYILYMETDQLQKEIAQRVKVTEKTLGKWIQDGEWELIKSANNVTRGQQIRNYLLQLKELNEEIADRDKKNYPNPGEADTIKKITASIKDLEKGITLTDYVQVFSQFSNWLQLTDLKAAQNIIDYIVEFTNLKAKELK